MDVWEALLTGFQVALTPYNLLFCFLGCLLGTLIGVLPGIGPTAGIAILMPLTFGLPPVTAFITMEGVKSRFPYFAQVTVAIVTERGG